MLVPLLSAHSGSSCWPPSEMCGIYSLSPALLLAHCLSRLLPLFLTLSLCVCVFSPSDLVSPLDISVVDYGGLCE